MAKTAKKTLKTKAKKIWFSILSSPSFGQKMIGETPAFEAEELIGRPVKVDLGTLVGDIKRQHVKITCEITEVEGHNAKTKITKYEISPSFIRRVIRKDKERLDESFEATTKDSVKIRIKPFMIVSKSVNSVQQKLLRKALRQFILKEIAATNFEDIIRDIISFVLIKKAKTELKKIYPVRAIEIKSVSIVKK